MKTSLGLIAIAVAFYSYIPYFRDILSGKTNPHAFSWFIWGLLTAIAFFAQLDGRAKAGAWVTGFTAVICFTIFGFALKVGRKNIYPPTIHLAHSNLNWRSEDEVQKDEREAALGIWCQDTVRVVSES